MPEQIQIVAFKPEEAREPFASRNTSVAKVDLFLPEDYQLWYDGGYQVNVENFGRGVLSFTLLQEKVGADVGLETFHHALTYQEAATAALRAVVVGQGGGRVKQARSSS